jgi:adenylate cyclase class 2
LFAIGFRFWSPAVLEIEMKFPGADFATLKKLLRKWKAQAQKPTWEEDHYFNAPDRDFAKTDEALRLRRVGKVNVVTYKGPKQGTQTKTRTEIEAALAKGDEPAEEFLSILQHLGYKPVAVVKKKRRLFKLKRGGFAMEVCLDDVEELGQFAEIEIRAPEARRDAAKEVLLETAKAMGLSNEERRSYLELLLEARSATKSP